MTTSMLLPYGNALINLMADLPVRDALLQQAGKLPAIKLDAMMQSDLVLLLTGANSPLTGYMGQADYLSVLNQMRLADGRVWPLPLTMVIPIRIAQTLKLGEQVALKGQNGQIIAVLTATEIYRADVALEAKQLGATLDFAAGQKWYVAGPVIGLALPVRYDFAELHQTPASMRAYFQQHGWNQIVACQNSQPMHRALFEFITRAAMQNQAGLMIQPMAGGHASERTEYYPLIRGYKALMSRLSGLTSILSLSENYPRRGGVRALLHRAILLRNYGCSHLVVGGESSTEGQLRRGSDVMDSQVFHELDWHINEIGVGLIPFPRMAYVEDRAQFLPLEEAPKESYKLVLGADEIKRRLQSELPIPDWYAFPEVLAEMRQAHPPRYLHGFTILLTGLAGVGKSTLAHALGQALMAIGPRKVTLLDNAKLALSPAVVAKCGALSIMAAEITRHGGIVICAVPSPLSNMRREMRQMVQPHGGFLELYLTAAAVVRAARSTDMSDDSAYEVPEQAELAIDTSETSIAQSLQAIILKLVQEGYLR